MFTFGPQDTGRRDVSPVSARALLPNTGSGLPAVHGDTITAKDLSFTTRDYANAMTTMPYLTDIIPGAIFRTWTCGTKPTRPKERWM